MSNKTNIPTEEQSPVTEKTEVTPEMPRDPKEAARMLVALKRGKKFGNLLGIAKKGGYTVIGVNLVTDAIRNGGRSCPLAVFLSEHASENSAKRIRNCCQYYRIPLHTVPLTTDALANAVGKSSDVAVVGVTDSGLCDALVKLL